MTRAFKVSPKTALRGAALASEVRRTYPLSKNDERDLRVAVKGILVKRLARASAPASLVRDFDVSQAASVLGVKATDLERELAGHGFDIAHPVRRRTASKARRASSRGGKTRRAARASVRG